MIHRRMRRRLGVKAALLIAAASVATGAIAQVGAPSAPLRLRSDYFGYGASVSPRLSYTDNIELLPDPLKEGSFIASTLLSGGAIYSANRFTGVLSGDLDLSFIGEGSDLVVNQRIGAASTTTLVDGLFYFDLAGSTSRQLIGENARFSSNVNAARGQRADVHNYSASPYLYRRFAEGQSAELRYRFSQVFIDDDNAGANPFAGGLLNDSTSHEAIAFYDSGSRLGRFNFTATGYGNSTVEDGAEFSPRFEFQQASFTGTARYALSDRFALSGAAGYDAIDTVAAPGVFDDEALSGFFWRAGFTARPGRKTDLRLEYGRRYDDDFIDAELGYEISSRLTFRASAGRSFETRAQSVASQFRGMGQATLDLAERLREGDALSAEAAVAASNRLAFGGVNAQTIGIGATNNAQAALIGTWERTEITASANYYDADFGFRQNTGYGGNLNIRRQVSRRLTAYGGAFYRHSEVDFDPAVCAASPFLFGFDVNAPFFDPVVACNAFAIQNGETDTLGGRVGASYQLYRNVSVFGEYARAERFADSPILEYAENSVTAGLTIDF